MSAQGEGLGKPLSWLPVLLSTKLFGWLEYYLGSFIALFFASLIIWIDLDSHSNSVLIYNHCGDTLVVSVCGSESLCCAQLSDTGTSTPPVAISGHVCPWSVLFHTGEKLTLEATRIALLICAAAEEEEIILHLMTPPGSCFFCMML